MDDFGYEKFATKQKSGMTVQTQVLLFVGLIAVLVFGYIIYQNYVLISTGEFARIERESKKSKKNRESWNASEIG